MTSMPETVAMVNIMTDSSAVIEKVGGLISSRVSGLRRRAGLSLDRLAERSGLSKGTVVGIENGRANPTIGILCRLAAALSVSVSDLVGESERSETLLPTERTTPRRLWESENGGAAILQAAIPGATMFELWSWTLGPNETYTSEAHSYGTAELIAVQSGMLEITVGSDSMRLGAGETARLRTDQTHSYRAIGREGTQFTMAVLERDISIAE
jgi:transcriptional regulator with XRE-family HTH domain